MTHAPTETSPRRSRRAPSGRRSARPPRRRRVWRWVALSLALLVLVCWWCRLLDAQRPQRQHQGRRHQRGDRRRPAGEAAHLGTEHWSWGPTPPGDNAELNTGKVAGARSDTALVMHIPEGRTEAVAISIPRDTLVTRPTCVNQDGSEVASAKRRDVQLHLLASRSGLRGQDGGADVRRPHGPLHGDRLRGLQGSGGRDRRCHRHRRGGHPRPCQRPRSDRRYTQAERHRVVGLCPYPSRRRRRQRSRSHRPSAAVHARPAE